MLALLTLLALTLGLVTGQQGSRYRPYYKDLMPGRYCEGRPDVQRLNCCPSRIDDCSAPIRETLCYCDQFCDRGASGDCCPDYWSFCLGEVAPEPTAQGCKYKGRTILPGTDVVENCNTCKCVALSTTLAELMCDTNKCLVQPDLLDDINAQPYYGFTASNYSQFWGKKLSTGLQRLLGTRYPNDLITQMFPVTKIFDPLLLPRTFDAREKREWAGRIGPVRDQGWCGASWAISTADVAADRLAIQVNGGKHADLSVQNILDCGRSREDGCQGGNLDRAWNYLRRRGVAEEQCYPYISGRTQTKDQCKMPRRSRRPVSLTCSNGTSILLTRKDKIGMQPPYRIASKEDDIKHELFYSGPVQAIMQVHEDFFVYRSGIYKPTGLRPSSRTAYHSVRILGWGEESDARGQPAKYWIVANSWGEQWGERGLFRIARGENVADIESFIVGAWAKTNKGSRRRSRYRGSRRQRREHLNGLKKDKKE